MNRGVLSSWTSSGAGVRSRSYSFWHLLLARRLLVASATRALFPCPTYLAPLPPPPTSSRRLQVAAVMRASHPPSFPGQPYHPLNPHTPHTQPLNPPPPPSPCSRHLQVAAVMRPLQLELRMLVERSHLPNKACPSDHLPIGAIVNWQEK